jgi:uncharacterized protein YndB with AHSA1/START domain
VSEELRVERLFPAPPEEVFDAFTEPEGQRALFGRDEPGWIVESEVDLRPGGVWEVAYGPSRQQLYRQRHVFRVVDRPCRLVFSTTETAPDGSTLELEGEITMEEQDGATLMTFVQRGFPDVSLRDLHAAGLGEAFDRIGRVIRARWS